MELRLTAGDPAVWAAALATAAVVMALLTWRTARPPPRPLPDLDGYFARWRVTHDGYDPAAAGVWVRGWLITVYRFACPLARAGVQPDVLTAWTLLVAAAVVTAAAAGGSWPALAGWLVLFAGLGDAVDGAVAVLTGRATRWGYVLDSVVDRCNDLLFAAALVVTGAPLWIAVVYGVLLFQLEYIRARAGNAGGSPVGTITVGERVNRVAFCAAGLFVAGLLPARAATVATVTVVVLAGLSLVGVGQLLIAVRRDLGASGRTDEVGDDGRREGDQGHPATRV